VCGSLIENLSELAAREWGGLRAFKLKSAGSNLWLHFLLTMLDYAPFLRLPPRLYRL
jgi:hypothetical protein